MDFDEKKAWIQDRKRIIDFLNQQALFMVEKKNELIKEFHEFKIKHTEGMDIKEIFMLEDIDMDSQNTMLIGSTDELIASIDSKLYGADFNREKIKLVIDNRNEPGRKFTICCPAHVENTPSFIVDRDAKTYRCLSCKRKGNMNSELEELLVKAKLEKLSPAESLILTLKIAGLDHYIIQGVDENPDNV